MAKIGEPGWRPEKVHPLAALFPTLQPDDLASLADHIKENGQQSPIIIDDDGMLIDGRMRLAACEVAGVEPRYERLNGHDAEAFIWGANAKRRQMTKGVLAMIGAKGCINVDATRSPKGGNLDRGVAKAAKVAGVSQGTMTKAFAVRDYSDLAQSVIDGVIQLDAAYEISQARKLEIRWRDEGLSMLRATAPDLASRVSEGEIDIKQARAELDTRNKAEEAQRDSTMVGLLTLTTAGIGFEKSSGLEKLPAWLETDEGERHLRRYFNGGAKEAAEKLAAARRGLDALDAAFAMINRNGKK